MSKASDNIFPSVLFVEGSAPANPASGDQRIFLDTADHKLKRVNSSGTVTTIEGSGGGSSTFAGDTDVSLSGLANLDQVQYQTGDSKFHNVKGGIVKLAETVLGSSAASITFTSISGSYRHLKVLYSSRSTAAVTSDDLKMQCNGDTGSNYDGTYLLASNGGVVSTAESGSATSATVGGTTGASAPASYFAGGEITFHDYASTSHHKTTAGLSVMRKSASVGDLRHYNLDAVWMSTAAITSLLFFPATGSFDVGTTISLYGIV